MKVKLIGKISGKYNGFNYYKLLLAREVESKPDKNIIADGVAIYHPDKNATSPYLKTTETVFNELSVGTELDTDLMFYDNKGRLVDC